VFFNIAIFIEGVNIISNSSVSATSVEKKQIKLTLDNGEEVCM